MPQHKGIRRFLGRPTPKCIRSRAFCREPSCNEREPRILGTAIFSVWGRPPRPRNLHERGGVRRVTSASSAPIRRARRSTCSMDSLNRARSGSGKFACVCCIAKASAITRSSFRCRGFNRSQSRRFALRFRPSHSSPVPAGRPASGSVELPAAVVPAVAFGFLIRNSIFRAAPHYLCVLAVVFLCALCVLRVLCVNVFSLFQRFHFFSIDLPSYFHAPRHAHRSRLKHQPAIAVIRIRKKHHLIQSALILQCHEHHVPVILRPHMPVSHHPPAQRHALPPQPIQLVAPHLAIPRQKIQRMPADAHLQNLSLVSQPLFLRVLRRRHPRQRRPNRITRPSHQQTTSLALLVAQPILAVHLCFEAAVCFCRPLAKNSTATTSRVAKFRMRIIHSFARLPSTSSNAPHLISASISSFSTGTRCRKSSSDRNAPPSSRARTIADHRLHAQTFHLHQPDAQRASSIRKQKWDRHSCLSPLSHLSSLRRCVLCLRRVLHARMIHRRQPHLDSPALRLFHIRRHVIKPRSRAAHRRQKLRRMMRLQIRHAVRNIRIRRRVRLAKTEPCEFLHHHPGFFALFVSQSHHSRGQHRTLRAIGRGHAGQRISPTTAA